LGLIDWNLETTFVQWPWNAITKPRNECAATHQDCAAHGIVAQRDPLWAVGDGNLL
jgi:hypothetical protein